MPWKGSVPGRRSLHARTDLVAGPIGMHHRARSAVERSGMRAIPRLLVVAPAAPALVIALAAFGLAAASRAGPSVAAGASAAVPPSTPPGGTPGAAFRPPSAPLPSPPARA